MDGEILGNVVRSFSQNELEKEEYFISLLFYLGMLTINKVVEGQTYLKIPNYSIKTLFWEYMHSYILSLEKTEIDATKLSQTLRDMAFRGDFESFLTFFVENYLKRLSNRDLRNFDEKYIKAMLLSVLFMSNLYHQISENENTDGYFDIYLQRHHAVPDVKFEYVFELKYLKTNATESEKEEAFAKAFEQVEGYKKDPRFAKKNDIRFIAIVFAGKGSFEARE